MATIILTFVILVLGMAGLAVGVLCGRTPIKGSCGGISCIKGIDCGACTKKRKGTEHD